MIAVVEITTTTRRVLEFPEGANPWDYLSPGQTVAQQVGAMASHATSDVTEPARVAYKMEWSPC
jgi:hypothetical protein